MQINHDSPTGVHSGYVKTYLEVAAEWFWVGMRGDIKEYVQHYQICQRDRISQQVLVGLLQPLVVPVQVWEDITLEFTEGLPLSNGVNVILVVVGRFKKYAHFLPLRHPFSGLTVANVFVKETVKLHGFPKSIISDGSNLLERIFGGRYSDCRGKFEAQYFLPSADGWLNGDSK